MPDAMTNLDERVLRAREVLATPDNCFAVNVSLLMAKKLATDVVELADIIEHRQKAHSQWITAGQRAGFVFSVTPDGFVVEHNPKLAAEMADYEAQNERIREIEAQLATARKLIEKLRHFGVGQEVINEADQFLKETEGR